MAFKNKQNFTLEKVLFKNIFISLDTGFKTSMEIDLQTTFLSILLLAFIKLCFRDTIDLGGLPQAFSSRIPV